MSRPYGWRPDVPDHRDLTFAPPAQFAVRVRPLGRDMPVDDQGDVGSCTGNASTAAFRIASGDYKPLSRLMAYYDGRALEGATRVDAGASIRDVVKGLSKLGVCDEETWPYVDRNVTRRPTRVAYSEGKAFVSRVERYERVVTLSGLKVALTRGLPVVFGFSVPEYFESDAVAKSGWVRLPESSDRMVGGHAVVAVGFDSTVATPYVWVRNSYSVDWGLAGHFKMDEKWFADPRRLVDDMWVIHPTGGSA